MDTGRYAWTLHRFNKSTWISSWRYNWISKAQIKLTIKEPIIRLKNCHFIYLKEIVDKRDGILSIAESLVEIPFLIKRTYYIYGFKDSKSTRGLHAHKNLNQVMFCINGSFTLTLDDGENSQVFILSNPNKGIYMGPKLWHKMEKFSKDCIVLIFASDYFNESDYIRDYNEFQQFISNQ